MKRVHFLGIAGSGASAAAAIAQAQGYKISGCDRVPPFNEFTKTLNQNSLFEGHSSDHLKEVDILTVTPAVFSLDPDNEELTAAKERGIETLTWQEFMGKYLEKGKLVIAVCGTHGKSTTTAMIGLLLEDAGLDPTVELGAVVPKWGSNYRVGKGKYFITEADEFNDNFLASHPDIAVITSIEMDHPEYFKDFTAYKNSFRKFLSQTKNAIVANLNDKGVREVLEGHPLQGLALGSQLIDFPLQVPGQHNVLNASAAYQVGLSLGLNPRIIKKSLQNFTGIGRRFEYLGEREGVKVYTDFAHHPTEIKATMEAAREKFPDQKITLVFQPHMFSRTKALFEEFVQTFRELPADEIYITDIYPSREVDTGLVNSRQLTEAVNKPNVHYLPQGHPLQGLAFFKTDIIFFMGAGNSLEMAKKFLEER